MLIRTLVATGFVATLLAAGSSLPASAAALSDRGIAKVAEATPVRPAAVSETGEEPNCSRARRRLWIEGEGWVVRRITTCR